VGIVEVLLEVAVAAAAEELKYCQIVGEIVEVVLLLHLGVRRLLHHVEEVDAVAAVAVVAAVAAVADVAVAAAVAAAVAVAVVVVAPTAADVVEVLVVVDEGALAVAGVEELDVAVAVVDLVVVAGCFVGWCSTKGKIKSRGDRKD
jgi:hypothetical protein